MSLELDSNAAEIGPVSPTKLMMLDDAIISASPGLGFEKTMDDIQLPTESEFVNEIVQRPGDLEIAGSAIIDKALKKTATGSAKKSVVGVTKKAAPNTKAPAKTAPNKGPVPKSLSLKTATTTKQGGTAPKPTSTVTGLKSGTVTKGAASPGVARKITASTHLTTDKPASITASKLSSGTNPKQLPVNKTSTSALPPPKKADVPAKKPVAATTKSSTTTTRPATAPVAKPSLTAKTTTTTVAKTTTTKTTTTTQPKLKLTTTASKSVAPVPTKRTVSAPVTKPIEKTEKDTVNKKILNSKSAVNGKTLPSEQIIDIKKSDAKVNGKSSAGKLANIKKHEGIKKEVDNISQIQENNVTTTTGFAEEHESMKVEELVPVIVEGVF